MGLIDYDKEEVEQISKDDAHPNVRVHEPKIEYGHDGHQIHKNDA